METSKNIDCLRKLLDEDINRLMSAEAQLKSNLVGWISKDCTLPLRTLVYRYIEMIERHLEVINTFCQTEQLQSIISNNRIMIAMTTELGEKLKTCSCPPVKDACLLAGIQTINHFKISAYGTAAAFAEAIGLKDMAGIFRQAEEDEKKIDEELSHLAANDVNPKALAPVLLSK